MPSELPDVLGPLRSENPFSATEKTRSRLDQGTIKLKHGVLSRSERLALLLGGESQTKEARANSVNVNKKIKDALASTIKGQDRESILDLIAKKREMFLVQMSLDIKRDEIRKLEEKTMLKEDALRK
jgi:hypothetical protein